MKRQLHHVFVCGRYIDLVDRAARRIQTCDTRPMGLIIVTVRNVLLIPEGRRDTECPFS